MPPDQFWIAFAAVMTGWVTATLVLIRGNLRYQDRVATTLDNHLGTIARSLTLVEERLSKTDQNTDAIKLMLANSTIVPAGTRAKVEVEPANSHP